MILAVWGCSHNSDATKFSAVELGETLFFDSGLSRDFSVACASCHKPQFAFADTMPFSKGFGGAFTKRNTPSLFNVSNQPYFMADGGVRFLKSQPLAPIEDTLEMHFSLPQIVFRLNQMATYKQAFEVVFQASPSEQNVLISLQDYVSSLTSSNPYTAYIETSDETNMSPKMVKGKNLFFGKAGCGSCHSGKYLSDYEFYRVIDSNDPGRARISRMQEDYGKMKTPSLYGVKLTAPYFHDGSVNTLDSAVSLMLQYGVQEGFSQPLSTQEFEELMQFMNGL